jgi:predicted ArsR family transcriptional regulator
MSIWDKQFDRSTRGRVVALLRQRDRTVEELAAELELTDNAIRAQLATLERDGIVESHGLRRGSGKPSVLYGVTTDFEGAKSRAYLPFAVALLGEVASRMPTAQVRRLVKAAGRRWAAGVTPPGGTLQAKVQWAADLLGELGGQVEVAEEREGLVLRGSSCPLSAVVRDNPGACGAVESLLSDLLGTPVIESCDRGGPRPCCRFVVRRRQAATRPAR